MVHNPLVDVVIANYVRDKKIRGFARHEGWHDNLLCEVTDCKHNNYGRV